MITLALLAAVSLHPEDPTYNWPEPPEEMVDFLGRRRLCLELPEPADRLAGDEREWARLNCTSLPEEERTWRTRYQSNADVRRWLDQDPRRFHLPSIWVSGYDGPPDGDATRLEISGVSFEDGSPFRVAVDRGAGNGRFTTFAVSFADVPARTFAIENARFPGLDLQSMMVFYGRPSPNERLLVKLRFGYPRGYCAVGQEDDRPELSIGFSRTEIDGDYLDRTNCGSSYVDLENATPAAD